MADLINASFGSKTQSDDLGVAGLLYRIEEKGCQDVKWINLAHNVLPLATNRQHSYVLQKMWQTS
jgi:hypothetical protein